MAYDSFKHHRRSVRLKGYDYAQAGAYFVTICVHGGQCVLGDVVDGAIQLSSWGRLVEREWLATAVLRENVRLDVHQIMPNHFHSLLWIEETSSVGAQRAAPLHNGFPHVKPGSLGAIIRGFKSAVTKAVNDLEGTQGAPFWQRSYYDQIIRNERHLTAVRQYILNNPVKWLSDKLHPEAPLNKFNRSWQISK